MQLALEFLAYFAFGFTRHLTLVGILLLLGALAFTRVGRSFGIDRLFWHERASDQFLAGLSTALLFAKVAFVGYLLDQERLRLIDSFHGAGSGDHLLAAALYLALFTVPIGTLWVALGLSSARGRRDSVQLPRSAFVLGATVGLAGSVGLLIAVAALLPELPMAPEWLVSVLALQHVPLSLRPLHVLAAVFMLALSTEYFIYAYARDRFTPAMAICTLLGLVAGITGFLEFRAWNPVAVVCALVMSVALGGLPKYKLRLWALRDRYKSPTPLATYSRTCAYPLVESERIPWRTNDGRKPLVLVCASGGGLRAALWTAEVLSQLELTLPDFASSVRIVAGASGGMLGASVYALTLLPPDQRRSAWCHGIAREELIARLGRDSLSAPIKRLFFRDLLLAGLPFVNLKSRGEALERCWDANLEGAFSATFGELCERERRGEVPSLVFAPMLVEDGRRLLISNLDLHYLAENSAGASDEPLLLSRSGFELARLFPEEFARFPVRTAARLSAAFPYVSPAVSLPTVPRRRVVDAGYYDNYGVNICANWLSDFFCSDARRRWIEENVSRIVIVQLRDRVSPLQGASRNAGERSSPVARGFEEISSPLEGVFSSRESVSVFRNDEQLQQVIRLYDAELERGFIRNEIFEYPGEASLSWYLSKAERDAISRAARELDLRDLRTFWDDQRPRPPSQVGVHLADHDHVVWGER